MIGDLPDADCAPPENVLFVCKLNPVTTDDDLEIIFSRFGKVVNCEVIRDKKTQESLQYAFVEFDEQKSCEAAYFKMDNVLIDDRRIHVDFSQSVSQYRWKGKGRLEVFNDEKKENRKQNNKSNNDIRDHKKRSSRDRSPVPAIKERKRSRSRERKKEKRSRSREQHDRKRSRSRDRDRKKSRSRSRDRGDRKREKRSRSREHNRRRSRSRDRHHHNHGNKHDRKRSRSRSRDRDRKRERDQRHGSRDRKSPLPPLQRGPWKSSRY